MSEASEKRVCKYRHCDVDISHRRPNALYCCDDHKRAEDQERNGRWVREPRVTGRGVGKSARTVSSRRRRRSRDGSGTRIYVLREDLEDLRDVLRGDGEARPEAADRLQAKVGAALGRLR